MPFPLMLHEMLDDAESGGFAHIVSWQLDGYGFKVIDKQQFVEHILPKYFNQNSYKSFLRQVNLYGFSRISKSQAKGGHAGGCYFHKHFIRGQKQLCAHISRQSATKKQSAQSATSMATNDTRPPGPKSAQYSYEVDSRLDDDSEEKIRASSMSSHDDYHDNHSVLQQAFGSNKPYSVASVAPTKISMESTSAPHFANGDSLPRNVALNYVTTWPPPSPSVVSNSPMMVSSIQDHIVNDPGASTSNNHQNGGRQNEAMVANAAAATLPTYANTAHRAAGPASGFESLYDTFVVEPMELDSARALLQSVDLFRKSSSGYSDDRNNNNNNNSNSNNDSSSSSDDNVQETEAV